MAFSASNDVNILSSADSGIVGAGAGNDRYIVSPGNLPTSTQTITISDTEGANTLQLIGGLTIASSTFAGTVAQLKLSNGATININGANNFTFELGGDPLLGTPGSIKTFAQFAASLGVATVPATGTAAGSTNVAVNANGTTTGGGPVVPPPTTASLTLTTGTDALTGTATSETFSGSINTLTANDSIIDSSTTDNDTLNVELLGGSAIASTVVIKSIENLNFNVLSGSATVDAGNFTGYKTVASTGIGTLTLANLADKSAELIVKGNASLSATYAAAVVAGGNDVVNVTLDAATGGAVTVGAGVETVNLTTKGGAATLTNFTAAAATTVVIKGGQGFTLGTPAAGFVTATTIDAREAGKASFTTSVAGPVAVLTGTSDDTVVRTVDFNASDLFSLGGGIDTLVMGIATATAQATFAGVDNVVFKGASSKIDMTKADQKAALTFEAGGIVSAQGLAAGSTVASTKVAAGVVTVEFRDSVMGETTTLNLAKGGTLDAVTVKNVKNLTVDYGAAAVGAVALDSTAAGTEVTTDLTVNAKQGAALSGFALTAATELKNLTINAQAAVTSVAATVSKLDTLTVNNTSNAAAVTLAGATASNAAGITSVKLGAVGGDITTGVIQNSGAIKEVLLSGTNTLTTSLTSTAANVDKLVSTATGDTVINITNAGTAGTAGTTVTLGDAALSKSNDLTILGATKVNNTVTGGTGVDKIKISDTGNNTINAGAGDDVISVAGGANMLTGGAGADTFTFTGGTGAITAAALAAKHTVINDFSGAAGQKDVIDFTAAITFGASASGVAVGTAGLVTDWGTNAAVTLADKITAAALTTGTAAGATVGFAHEGKSYLYVSGDNNTTVDAVDTLIELTGVALSSGFTIVTGNISAFA